MKYKIGDKVKFLPDVPGYKWKSGTIIETGVGGYDYYVRFTGGSGDCWCPYYENELELIGPKPGEQLLFSFMLPEPT